MTEPDFTATGVRIDRRLRRSLTRAGQVRISDGRLELLTSYGSEIDSAPLNAVRAGRPWFATHDRARATVNGRRYSLTLRAETHDPDPAAPPAQAAVERDPSTARRFLEAVRRAGGRLSRA
ncbi:hypothetical protein DY218_19320 [Streptomyces triticagri]|uniref:Uncharacterized protein n=1 Tax=Streptomyces triticagri TaxID=2293568 RepID=A0A372M2C5_9ACTN|nr:hypothetical protein [Streptomyces triticagri]RFU85082.1 hypothetical protein DY218_19320 [Streptomyces triticagri]